MPLIKIDHIVSFSSEDPVHVANNILSSDVSKKWKCRSVGEKNSFVVLQLEKASLITGIDIGNEHSAYIEVLVSRSGMSDDYKVLLVMSAFMSPLESRQSQNGNKVRMFQKENLSKPECEEKWDRVKIVCTQPFNKHIQYGLSFINIHTTSDNKETSAPVQNSIGNFTLRPESPDNLSAGSIFSKRKEMKQDEKLTGAAAIREAASSSSLAIHGSPVCKPKLKNTGSPAVPKKDNPDGNSEQSSRSRNRNELLYSKDEEEPNEKIDKIIEKKVKEIKEKKNSVKDVDKTPKNKDWLFDASETDSVKNNQKKDTKTIWDVSPSNSPSSSKQGDHVSRKKENEHKRKHKAHSDEKKHTKKIKKDHLTKPFERLLEGVSLVISGIQNPDRSNLRSLALSLGAKYKSDWDDSCTHLICAFSNTPKFNQVKGKGKIVKRTWIEDCHSQRKRLPWRRYALDKNDARKDESEDEISETVANTSHVGKDDFSDVEIDDFSEHKEEASDTEERIAKIQELQNKKKDKDGMKDDPNDHIYIIDTDIEEDDYDEISDSSTKKLGDIFNKKNFYIDHTFDDEVYNKLNKYIVAYKGKSVDDPTVDVDIIITPKQNSNTMKEINIDAKCVRPDWIWECHNSQKLVPVNNFLY